MAIDIDIDALCIQVRRGEQLCVTLPGNVEICAKFGIDLGDASMITKSLLAEANSALAPLIPIFGIIDVVVAIVECIKAIPDAIAGTPPDPTKIAECLPGLIDALSKLIGLPLAIPKMVKQILLAIVESLFAILAELEAFVAYQVALLNAATAAAEPGNIVLQAIVDCEQDNFAVDLENLNASAQPLNRLIGVVNLLLEPLIGEKVPTFDDLGTSAEEAIEPLRQTLEVIQAVIEKIPVPA